MLLFNAQALEPQFTAELLATLLSIPGNKTLLRRHLNTHFVTLIGSAMQQRKRENEQKPGHVPLTPNTKIKVRVRSLKTEFGVVRKTPFFLL